MIQIPDAPWIREAERDGLPDSPEILCPVCYGEADKIYVESGTTNAVGCGHCINKLEIEAICPFCGKEHTNNLYFEYYAMAKSAEIIIDCIGCDKCIDELDPADWLERKGEEEND